GGRVAPSPAIRLTGTAAELPLREGLLDHEMAGLAVTALDKAARREHLLEVFQHRRAAAHHDAVGFEIERSLPEVVEQLPGGDEVGDAATVAERLAGDGRIIAQLL